MRLDLAILYTSRSHIPLEAKRTNTRLQDSVWDPEVRENSNAIGTWLAVAGLEAIVVRDDLWCLVHHRLHPDRGFTSASITSLAVLPAVHIAIQVVSKV